MEQSAYPVKENHGNAVASLVLGIISLFFVGVNIILGIIAIVLGVNARKKIREEPERYEGDGMATAGIILGAIGIGFGVIFVLIWVVIAIVAASYLT